MGSRFSAPFQTGPGAYPASYTLGTESFPGVKRPGRGVDHPPPSSAEVKERVELYLYSPLGLRGLFQGELYPYLYLYSICTARDLLEVSTSGHQIEQIASCSFFLFQL